PRAPFYFFIPRDQALDREFHANVSVDRLFPVHVTGVVTARDQLVIDFTGDSVLAKINIFRDPKQSLEYVKEFLRGLLGRRSIEKVENYAWDTGTARRELQALTDPSAFVKPFLYRPFDERRIFYHPAVVWRTRTEVMRHLLRPKNVALIVPKQNKRDFGAFV